MQSATDIPGPQNQFLLCEIDNIKNSILNKIIKQTEQIEIINDSAKISNVLTKIKEDSRNMQIFQEDINKLFDETLQTIKTKNIAGFNKLGFILNQNEIGRQILSEHSQFEGYQRVIYNQRIKSYTIDQVLNKIEGNKLDHGTLKQRFSLFTDIYGKLVQEHLNPNLDFNSFLSKWRYLIDKIKKNDSGFTVKKGVRGIKQVFGIGKAEKERKISLKWDSQTAIYAVELVAYLFAYWTLKNSKDYFDAKGQQEQQLYLFNPHPGQIISIFRILGLGAKTDKVQNHLIEIKTGEGKSITIAIAAAALALLGCKIYVACYSQYLTDRDYEQFKSFFIDLGIEKSTIEYGTFNTLAERIINERGDIRDVVENLVTNQGQITQAIPQQDKRQKILFVDEVDVFFSKELYGNTYSAQSSLRSPEITNLIDYIWKTRDDTLNYDSLKQSQEYKSCLESQIFKGFEFLIEAALRDMFNDIKDYKAHDYKVDRKKNKIGYKEQDNIVFNCVYGYKTLFAYYNEIEHGVLVEDKHFQQLKSIGVNCGQFSYAEVLLNFEIILGVTGTLKNLSQMETNIIKNYYNINMQTFIPSVYGDSKLQPMSERDDILIMNKNDYFNRILEEIDKKTKRAVLVFFESKKLLEQFEDYSNIKTKYQSVQKLTEDATEKEKKNYINSGSCQGYITLLTREYGRGTDFISRDDNVRDNGGVHVIQTFLSEEQSEETQIKGRTARQGQCGSYSMVLLDSDLEKYGVDLKVINDDPCKQYTYMKGKRNEFFETQYNNNIAFVEIAKREHDQATKFLSNLFNQHIQEVRKFLEQRNQGSQVITKTNRVRTIILMDATYSMSGLLQKAKNTVQNMFERAYDILQQTGLNEKCFQIQFAVYRNYGSREDLLLQYSPWESQPQNLYNFMKNIDVEGGEGNEAIEIGFSHCNLENQKERIQQVILIGDAPPNTKAEVTNKRKGYDWSKTKYNNETHFKIELDKLKKDYIPIHAFYVAQRAKADFENISYLTKGNCQYLDIHSSAGADMLTDFVTKEVIRKVGDTQGIGEKCVVLYEKKYGKSYI